MTLTPVETIRVNETAKRHLSTLKRRTGIKNWNVLCRWALCLSLGDSTPPQQIDKGNYSNVEMSWSTFGGSQAELYATLVAARCQTDGLDITSAVLAEQFRLHLHRGITNLVGMEETRTLEGFLRIASVEESN
jgi:DNA sulfur modification protein DndE